MNRSSVHLIDDSSPTTRLGALWTYDAEQTATLIDNLLERVQRLEHQVASQEQEIRALLLTVRVPRPWWQWWGR